MPIRVGSLIYTFIELTHRQHADADTLRGQLFYAPSHFSIATEVTDYPVRIHQILHCFKASARAVCL